MNYKIVTNHGHYEVYVDGEFFCSTDTMIEAVREVENY